MEYKASIKLPRWDDLPDFPLYIDQVVNYIETNLKSLSFTNEKIITNSMINNYVKHGIVEKPTKKNTIKINLLILLSYVFLNNLFL